MPIQANQNAPIRTVDSNGNTLSTANVPAAPVIKTIDTYGREIKAEAKEPEAPKTGAQTSEPPKEKEPTNADVRKAYLDAQKTRDRALALEKKAKANLSKAEAMEKAVAAYDTGKDPTAILKAAGLDHIKFYQQMTDYALNHNEAPEDPVQKELKEQRARLEKYEADLKADREKLQSERDTAAHNRTITDHVIPLLKDNPERFEAILTNFGRDTAVEVYKTVWEIYQKTGKARSFAEVADEMEVYWSEKIDQGIQAAYRMKKFQNRFAQSGNETKETQSNQETPKRSNITLSNQQTVAPLPASPQQSRKSFRSLDERTDYIRRRDGW